MAHEIDLSNNRENMAYVGAVPWHGLGQQLSAGAPIETWVQESGMNYDVLPADLSYHFEGQTRLINNKQALYRSDTGVHLGIVGDRYQVVQPKEVLEFFRDLTEERGFVLETAGVLFNGARYWALARTPHSLILPGNDEVREFLMLGTACDGSMATVAKYVRTRVVCHNTIQVALKEAGSSIRVEHRSKFHDKAVKRELNLINEDWEKHAETLLKLAQTPVDEVQATEYLVQLVGKPDEQEKDDQLTPTVEALLARFLQGDYLGSDMKSAKFTAWGLLNTVTEHVDWHRGELQDRRIRDAWFGKGMALKQKALDLAVNITSLFKE